MAMAVSSRLAETAVPISCSNEQTFGCDRAVALRLNKPRGKIMFGISSSCVDASKSSPVTSTADVLFGTFNSRANFGGTSMTFRRNITDGRSNGARRRTLSSTLSSSASSSAASSVSTTLNAQNSSPVVASLNLERLRERFNRKTRGREQSRDSNVSLFLKWDKEGVNGGNINVATGMNILTSDIVFLSPSLESMIVPVDAFERSDSRYLRLTDELWREINKNSIPSRRYNDDDYENDDNDDHDKSDDRNGTSATKKIIKIPTKRCGKRGNGLRSYVDANGMLSSRRIVRFSE